MSKTGDNSKMTPRGDIRLIYNGDLGLPIRYMSTEEPTKEGLHAIPDHLAANGVDVYAQDVFNSGNTMWDSKYNGLMRPDGAWQAPKAPDVFAAGLEPIEILVERSHFHGMKFIAGFRMSDRHHRGLPDHPHHGRSMGRFIREHQDLWIKDFPYDNGALDYNHKEVRDWMFNTMEEAVQRFDVDGLELNYMRYPHVFPPGHPEVHEPILTQFTARVREMLDVEGRKRGRRLLLQTQVPQTLEECHFLSLDVPTWIKEGLIDHLVPSDFGSADNDAPYDEFARLTRESECLLFPAAHVYASRDPSGGGYHWVLMSEPGYRGQASNFYAQGADGAYMFNLIYHWFARFGIGYPGPMDMYPKAFAYLRALREPETLADHDRHYISYPMITYFGLKDRKKKIVLDRATAPCADRYVFRAAEGFTGEQEALLRFHALGLVPGDQIEVTFNGATVPPEKLTRTHFEKGRKKRGEGATLDPFTRCEFVPTRRAKEVAQNILEMKLLASAPGAEGEIRVQEIELAVSASGAAPAEIMTLIHHRTPPPVESLAGYHPEAIHGFYDSRENGTTGHVGAKHRDANDNVCGAKGAQSFVLTKQSRIARVQLLVHGVPKVEEPFHLSIRADRDGIPADAPAGGATATFNPWKRPEGLTFGYDGYYTFDLQEEVVLDPGAYWLVFEMDSGRQPEKSYYAPLLSVSAWEHYPRGRYMTLYALEDWQKTYASTNGWREIDKDGQPVCAFFSVFGEEVA